jgi:hypothetical protein
VKRILPTAFMLMAVSVTHLCFAEPLDEKCERLLKHRGWNEKCRDYFVARGVKLNPAPSSPQAGHALAEPLDEKCERLLKHRGWNEKCRDYFIARGVKLNGAAK